jgi:3-deoxy-7-phosphoheptulonate synthase
LQLLREGANAHDLKLVTEVMDASQIEVIGKYADIYQVARATCRTSRCSASSGGRASRFC